MSFWNLTAHSQWHTCSNKATVPDHCQWSLNWNQGANYMSLWESFSHKPPQDVSIYFPGLHLLGGLKQHYCNTLKATNPRSRPSCVTMAPEPLEESFLTPCSMWWFVKNLWWYWLGDGAPYCLYRVFIPSMFPFDHHLVIFQSYPLHIFVPLIPWYKFWSCCSWSS